MHTITKSVDVDATPDVVWDVLTDFDAYGEWNPFMSVVGRANEGARLSVEITPPGKSSTRFRPTVTRADPGRELRWLGHLVVAGGFDGDHRFTLEPTADGTTRFTQAESFRGVLSGPLFRFFGGATERGFDEMNAALKARAEAVAAESPPTV